MWNTIGQNRAVALLESSIKREKVAHAYLFSGPAHIGKMTLARDLSCALNCSGSTPPCNECFSCQRIFSGKHSDVLEIGLNKNTDGKPFAEIGIEEIRQIQHSANLPPFEGKCRVYIIDGAELLSPEAANCLLKTLEEPTGRVVFILLTAQEHLLPATVISRCQRIELFPVPRQEITRVLTTLWHVPDTKAELLSRISHGKLGWAVQAAETDLMEKYSDQIDEIVSIVSSDMEDRFQYATRLANEFSQEREKVQERLLLWRDWWHDLLLVKYGMVDMVVNVNRLDVLERMGDNLSPGQIRPVITGIMSAGEQLKLNANARLTLEVLMLSIPSIKMESVIT